MNALALLAASLLSAAEDKADARKVLDQVQGTWAVTKLIYNGEDLSDKDYAKTMRFAFKGGDCAIEGSEQVTSEYAKLVFKFDPSTTPKLVDIAVMAGSQKGLSIEGIYELKGDELKLCARVLGKERPADFESKEGST